MSCHEGGLIALPTENSHLTSGLVNKRGQEEPPRAPPTRVSPGDCAECAASKTSPHPSCLHAHTMRTLSVQWQHGAAVNGTQCWSPSRFKSIAAFQTKAVASGLLLLLPLPRVASLQRPPPMHVQTETTLFKRKHPETPATNPHYQRAAT